MKQILSIALVLVVLAVAILGCLAFFDVMSYEYAMSKLMKVVAAIVLLGGCSAANTALMRSKKEP